MKTIILTFLTLVSLNAIELDWIHDYDKALAKAQEKQKNIYVFVGADKCRFCDMFKTGTLQNKVILQRLHEEFVLVYLSRDRHKIPEGLETKGVPKHYFLDKEGKKYFYTWGYFDCKGFNLTLDEASMYAEDE